MSSKKKKIIEWNFLGKVVRNGFVLAGLYFISVFASGELTFETLKPVIIFYATYVLTEYARKLGLKPEIKGRKTQTLILA